MRGTQRLNVIEKYFGMSPDGGDRSIEMMALVLVVALCVLVGLLLTEVRQPTKLSSLD
jgi:hypothetical protein